MLRRVFADGAAGNAVPSPVPVSGVSSTCILDSPSEIDLLSFCCPLPLTVNDADFMSNLLFGFASVQQELLSVLTLLVLLVLIQALSLLCFLCSPLCTSSASASLITSFLRSNLSAPRGVVLRHSSILILQRSEWTCALLLSLIALPSHGGSEFVDVLLGDSFPLDSCSLEWQRRDWDRIHSDLWSVHCPLTVCHSPGYSNHTVDGFCVPYLS